MGGAEPARWLESLVLDGHTSSRLRERAVREFAEGGASTPELVRLYDRAVDRAVRVRLIRIFADRADDASRAKLNAIMQSDTDAGLRQEAERRYRSGSADRNSSR